GISVNPNQSPNDNARYLFMVDLLIELQPKSARSQAGITLFRGLSPAIAIEGRVPAARPHHANSARIPLYGILATTSIHPTLSRVSWGSDVGLSCGSTSGARASSRSSRRPSGPALREHAAVLLHQRPRLTKGSQRQDRRHNRKLARNGLRGGMDKPEACPSRHRRHGADRTRRRRCRVVGQNPTDYTAKEYGSEAEDGSVRGGLPVRR